MDKLALTTKEWALDTLMTDYIHNDVRDAFNTALALAIELEDKTIVDRVLKGKYKDFVTGTTEHIVNGIWVAVFGKASYEGHITPAWVTKWGERVGYPPILPLDVSAGLLADWAEGQSAPEHITKAVRRSLEEHGKCIDSTKD